MTQTKQPPENPGRFNPYSTVMAKLDAIIEGMRCVGVNVVGYKGRLEHIRAEVMGDDAHLSVKPGEPFKNGMDKRHYILADRAIQYAEYALAAEGTDEMSAPYMMRLLNDTRA
jgi:hypothetical protein